MLGMEINGWTLQDADGNNVCHVGPNADLREYPHLTAVKGHLPLTKWEQPGELQIKRNAELESTAWTIREDSPLSESCKQAWLEYRRALHRVTIGDPWPDRPGFEYA